MLPRQLLGLTAVVRLMVLLAMGAPILWFRDLPALLGLAAIGGLWALAQLGSQTPRLARFVEPTAEAAAVGVLCGLVGNVSLAILASLAIAPFVAGLRRGLPGVALALATQTLTLLVTALVTSLGLSTDEGLGVVTWSIAGLGLGFLATFARATVVERRDELVPYLEAQALIRELIGISGDLASGLDVTSLAGKVVSTLRDRLPTSAAAVYAGRGEILVPLVTQGADDALDRLEVLAFDARAAREGKGETRGDAAAGAVIEADAFAFRIGNRLVLGGVLAPSAGLGEEAIRAGIAAALEDLRVTIVQVDTALLFADFRDAASSDVRNRLAREMHDGIAQDIAALGYVVDALAATATTDTQTSQFTMLRDRITTIVGEVRQSVLTLRTSIGEEASLGAAISTVARHLSESSRIPIQVTLDEHATRLQPAVEAELFRIAQESMNNAIKHARCETIEVVCQVHAPDALITVADDGRGMGTGRSDSHGMKIMRERARLAGADLTIAETPGGGVTIAVQISATGRIPPFPSPSLAARVVT